MVRTVLIVRFLFPLCVDIMPYAATFLWPTKAALRRRDRTTSVRDAAGSAMLGAWSTCPECRDRRWTG